MKAQDTKPGNAAVIAVATFNLRYGTADDGPNSWEARRALLMRSVDSMEPAILSTQEGLSFQLDEIKRSFPRLDRFGLGRFHGVATDRAHEAFSGEHCDIFYDTNRLELIDWNTFWHSDAPQTAGPPTWGNSLPRITTWGCLRNRETGTHFVVVNTHMHWDEPYVSRTTELLVRRIPEVTADRPFVVTGDFNVTPESSVYRELVGALDLRDAWTETGGGEEAAGTSHRFEGIPRRRIDWILAGPGVEVQSARRVEYQETGRFPSDHYPVLAELRI